MARSITKIVNTRVAAPVQMGPWPLGLNNREGDLGFRDIKPTELLKCENFDVTEAGYLVNRNGFVSWSPDIFPNIVGTTDPLTIRNVIGSVRLDATYNEALVQLEDPLTRDVYVLKNSVSLSASQDFAPGYWIKQAVIAGQKFFLTAVVRYHQNVYLTTNNAYLNEVSSFTGGFYYGNAVNNFVAALIATGIITSSMSIVDVTIDSAGNLFYAVQNTTGTCKIIKVTPAGVVTDFLTGLTSITSLACDTATNIIYFVGFGATFISAPIFKVTAAGVVSTFYPEEHIDDANFNYYGGNSGGLAVGAGRLWTISHEITTANGSSEAISLVFFDLTTGAKTYVFSELPVGFGDLVMDSLYHDGINLYGSKNGQIWVMSGSGISLLFDRNTFTYTGSPVAPVFSFPAIGTPGTGVSKIANFGKDLAGNWYYADYIVGGDIFTISSSGVVSTVATGLNMPLVIIDATGRYFAFEQGANKVTKFTPASGPVLNAITSMPFGDIAFMFKDRLWIINKATNQINYSVATDPANWNSVNGAGNFQVNPGDGLTISDVVVANNQMIIFKESGTWRFTFTADPAVDGVLAVISRDRGAFSATVYNNTVYLVGRQGVQKLINGFFIDISQQIRDFHPAFTVNSIIDSITNKLFVTLKHINDADPQILCMNLFSQAWSTYQLNDIFPSTQFPIESHMYACGNNSTIFLAQKGSALVIGAINNLNNDIDISLANGTLRYYPAYDMQTKYYDFNTPLNWKKLTRTSVDVIFNALSFQASLAPYAMNVYMYLFSPTEFDTAKMPISDTLASPLLGPDGFPIMQLVSSLGTDGLTYTQDSTAHRFQAASFRFVTDQRVFTVTTVGGVLPGGGGGGLFTPHFQIVGLPSSGGGSFQLVLKKFSAYITQKISKGQAEYVG